MTLGDETGTAIVIDWRSVAEAQRRPLLAVYGVWRCQGEARHLVAKALLDHLALWRGLVTHSRNCR